MTNGQTERLNAIFRVAFITIGTLLLTVSMLGMLRLLTIHG